MSDSDRFSGLFRKLANAKPIDDFQGLSAEQMHHFLYFPFVSPDFVRFPECLEVTPEAPILYLFSLIAEAIGEKGLKPTAKGNLPRNVVRQTALTFLGEDGYRDRVLYGGMYKEADFPELETTRVVAQLAGLIRKYRGKFILSRECRQLLAESGFRAIYPRLFRAYVDDFNWEYRDPYQECPLIQQAVVFSLYLLVTFGDRPRPQAFYESCFLKAFPQVLDRIAASPRYGTDPELEFRVTYTRRTLEHFLAFFGLARAKPLLTERTYGRDYEVIQTPLLGEVVQFHQPGDSGESSRPVRPN